MPPKKIKPKHKNYSCVLCPELDFDDMVACDECDKWFHFECVGVTSAINDTKWSCERCKNATKKSSIDNLGRSTSKASSLKISDSARIAFSLRSSSKTSAVKSKTSAANSHGKASSKATSMTSRQKVIALEMLEEEQRIRLDILERKHQILRCSEKSSDTGDDLANDQFDQELENDSLEYTLHWAKKVQEYPKNDVSITSSDKEREQVNKVPQQSAILYHGVKLHENRVPVNQESILLEQFKKFQQSKLEQNGIQYSEKPKVQRTELKSSGLESSANSQVHQSVHKQFSKNDPTFDQLSQVQISGYEHEVNLTNHSNVYQQRMKRGQGEEIRSDSKFDFSNPTIQQPMQFGFDFSGVQKISTKNGPANVQNAQHQFKNVDFNATNVPNVQNRQMGYGYGFGTTEMQNKQQSPVNCFGSTCVPNNQQSNMNGFGSSSVRKNQQGNYFANGSESQQQQSNIPYSSFGLGSLNQQQSLNLGLGQQSFSHAQANRLCLENSSINGKGLSGYAGYVGPLTPSHIAARHTYSKDLPHFYGKPEQWPMFLSALLNSTEACGFSDGDNLSRLQRCIKGDAFDAVQGRLLYPSSVPGVVETLYLMFGRPSLIIHKMLDKINKTQPPSCFGNHNYYKCTKKSQCGIDECTYNHHILLHNSKENREKKVENNISHNEDEVKVSLNGGKDVVE